MAQKQLAELTLEELKVKQKGLTIVVSVMGVMIAIMAIAGIFITIRQGFGVFTVTPLPFLFLLLVQIGQLKNTKKEIASRN